MPRTKRSKPQHARKNKRARNEGKAYDEQSGAPKSYQDVNRNNDQFESYYKEILPEGEYDAFIAQCREPLPATFRITGTRSAAEQLRDQLEPRYFRDLEGLVVEGEAVEPPRPLPWYPDRLGWHMNFSRMQIRKEEKLKQFHRFLISESEQGNISRQEAVSMIPPLFLDVQPHHKVLDMCAAPGSKTAQLIEFLHANNEPISDGFIIANDADAKRCYMLVRQTKRLQSPCLLVTSTDASQFPSITLKTPEGEQKPVVYDRILCDVPCSGDGTIRKNVLVWRKWNPVQGPSLHTLQVRIAKRGIQQMAVGGLMTYSTCSFHPAENEAVIATLLREFKGMVELVDVSDKLPELIRSPGLTSWPILARRSGTLFRSFEDVPQESQTRFKPSMFPPTAEENEWMHLERCVRIYPHQQDTGGFFIALLRKTAPVNRRDARRNEIPVAEETAWREGQADADGDADEDANADEMDAAPADDNDDDGAADQAAKGHFAPVMNQKKKKQRVFKEEPFILLDEADADVKSIVDFYGLQESFPKHLLLTRSAPGSKRKNHVYCVSPEIKGVLEQYGDLSSVKIINTGVKIFTRSESVEQQCDFRLCQEGLHVVFPHLSDKRKLVATQDDVRLLASRDFARFSELSKPAEEFLQSLGVGCAVLYAASTEDLNVDIKALIWRGRNSVRLMVPDHDRDHLRLLLGLPIELPEDKSSKKQKAQDEAGDGADGDTNEGAAGEDGGKDDQEAPADAAQAASDKPAPEGIADTDAAMTTSM